jgi:hypothetical protein
VFPLDGRKKISEEHYEELLLACVKVLVTFQVRKRGRGNGTY